MERENMRTSYCIRLGLMILCSTISFNLHAQEGVVQDSVVARAICAHVEYCTNTDAAISSAIESGFPIIYPTLAVNGVVISDKKDIDLIRNSLILGSGYVAKKVGPYKIKRVKRYSSEKAERMGIHDVSKHGVVVLYLIKDDLFDIDHLETWLHSMYLSNPSFKTEKYHLY